MCRFKTATDTTVHRYIEHERLERVAHLLCSTDLKLAVIAAEVGLASSSHLSRSFSRAEGVTPSSYRERFRSMGA